MLPTDDVREYLVERATKSTFNIEAMESLANALGTPLDTLPAISITRLAWAKDGWFLAALAVAKDEARIIIWDMSRVKDPSNPAADISGLHQNCVIATVEHQDIDQLSIGLAISAKGDQVAIYQEPKIGYWKAGSQLELCEFQLHLYNFVLDLNQQTGNRVSGNTLGRLELQVGHPHSMFDTFIGYGAFLTNSDSGKWMREPEWMKKEPEWMKRESEWMKKIPEWMKELEWMKKKPDPSRIGTVGVEDCGTDDGEEEERSDDINHTGSSEDSTVWTFFAACDGIYIDIFEISPELKWTHIHAIQLTVLVPTLNWRATCLMMMETMTTSDTFMWLEDDGCCSIWDLQNGSNITYISCKKNSTFYDTNIREAVRMAISPDGSIVASADSDGTLTTYYTRTGIEINNRRFLCHKVEYIGFHGKNNQLFVVFRDTVTFKLSSKILDPLLLKSDTTARTVPVPMIGTAIFAFSDKKGFDVEGLVCEANGSRIRCYISHESGGSEVALDESTRVDTSTLQYQLPQSGDVGEQLYRIRTWTHKELFRNGDESTYWVSSVEIVEESSDQAPEKVIFSFVPEPWTRVSTESDTHPENLQSAYFLPGDSRFVVAGIQTLQIWDLPKDDNDSCSLVFIWSQPISRGDSAFQPPEKGSGRVEDYYHKIQKSTIYLDQDSGNVVADINLMHGADTIQVHIPRSGCSNDPLVFRHCFRSVHLLAATYAFCLKESKKISRDSVHRMFSFGSHAEALVMFSRDHINRALFVKRQSHTGKEVTTLLMLLMSRPDLKDSNYVFIEGLLNTTLGEWVPHPCKALNPIAYATSTKDEQLLNILTTYCIKRAKAYHPAYLFPVDQCLDELLDHFPDMLADIFRKASYIPAQKQTFPLSRIRVVDFTYSDGYRYILNFITFVPLIGVSSLLLYILIPLGWILFLFRPTLVHRLRLRHARFITPRQRPLDANYSRKSVFIMRPQLPYIRTGFFLPLEIFQIRFSRFPSMQITTTRTNTSSRKVCVSPFQLQPVQDSKHESIVSKISGKDFFDIPTVVASLRLNWYDDYEYRSHSITLEDCLTVDCFQ
jgi:WD40 repeat protein